LGEAAWREARARFTRERCVREHLAVCESVGKRALSQMTLWELERDLTSVRPTSITRS
jgi:hypothetical protein